jgi:hypothetical protein|tara:strand:- start:1860 stop:2444 length:585 start_codon:yes stop_codon:yes gene_type:complete
MKFSMALLSYLALSFLLSGCQSTNEKVGADKLPLLPQNTWQQSIQVNQSIEIEYEGRNWNGIAVLELSPDKLTMVHLSPLGQRLFTLIYDNGKTLPEIDADSILVGQTIPAATIVSLLQIAIWPTDVLAPFYQGDWRLQTGEQSRMVFFRNKLVVSITLGDMLTNVYSEPWPASINIRKAEMDMNIKTLDYKLL